ncbi:MAG: DotU family type IV/VI secretion system protein [Myxococcales bacterium]|nr:DotU family type IV/VI secretion system protein [Myxococcales bacterium]
MTLSKSDSMYFACADVLALGNQLATRRDLPPPDELQRRVSAMLETMTRRCREAQIPDSDIEEAKYAVVALIDEQIFRSPWPGRQQWLARPLQFVYYNENTAGEGFFQRLERLQVQPDRRHVLEVYFLCLALGFQGKYAVRGGDGLLGLSEHVGSQLAASLPGSDVISPRGEAPETVRGGRKQNMPIVAVGLGFFAFTVVIFMFLKAFLWFGTQSAASTMTKAAPVVPAGKP